MKVTSKKVEKRVKSLRSKVNFEKGLLFKSIIEFDLAKENDEGTPQDYILDLSTGTTCLSESRKNEVLKEIEWTPIYSEVDKFTKLNGEVITYVRLYQLSHEEETEEYKQMVRLGDIPLAASYCFREKDGELTVCEDDSYEAQLVKAIHKEFCLKAKKRQKQLVG